VIKRYEHNEYITDTVNAIGIPKQTLRTTWKQGEKISAIRITASKITQIRAPIMENMEMMLAQWTENQHQNAFPLSLTIIQAQAQHVFQNMNATETDLEIQSFAASAGWFQCFKKCHGIHNRKLTGS
jgi:hypothetical protein